MARMMNFVRMFVKFEIIKCIFGVVFFGAGRNSLPAVKSATP